MLTSSNSFLLMHIYSKNFSQAEKEMIVKVFRGISKDFAELTKTAQMEKKLQIILVLISEVFLLYHSLITLC
jgi:hypothetical protein